MKIVQFAAASAELITYLIADVSPHEHHALLVLKFKQCSIIFDFDDPLTDVKSKEVKRMCLAELVDYLSKPASLSTEELYVELIHMVSSSSVYLFTVGIIAGTVD